MVPDELPRYNVPRLENKALKFLRDQLGESFTHPIDVEYILEALDGVDLDVWPALRQNHGILGAVFRVAGENAIIIYIDEGLADDDSKRNRYRMTVAEELAHIVLHRDVIDSIDSLNDFRSLQRHPQWADVERDAKRFAAALLMPSTLVQSEAQALYRDLVDKAGFGDVEVIKKYLRNLLATRFEVSPESMHYRLNEYPLKIYQRVELSMSTLMSDLLGA